EFGGQFFTHLAVAAKTEPGEQRRAAEDDRVAIVVDEIFYCLFDALKLLLEVRVHELAHGARGIHNHETVREHFVEFIDECVSSRRSDVAYTSAPSVHASFLLMFVRKTSRRSKGSCR